MMRSLWSLAWAVVLAHPAGAVVINEIHFDPADKKPLEFVELYNPADAAVPLGGWRLDKFRFPEGAVIDAKGYAVVAEDPVRFEKEYGKKAFGPLSGKLKNGGEKITLEDRRGKKVEQVKFGVGFPWPVASAGTGSSLERVHPALAADEAGNWRASGFPAVSAESQMLVPPGSTWKWRAGKREASEPANAWRMREFVEDAGWQTGKAGFGYGDDDDATQLPEMQNGYGSVFLRHAFVAPKVRPDALVLRARVDDGCIVWLNGREIARLHVPAGEPTIETLAEDHEAENWEEVMIPNAAALLADGTNILAVQAFNSARDSSDLSIDVALQTPGSGVGARRPTPGAANSTIVAAAIPACRGVHHEPDAPTPGVPVRVTAEFSLKAPPVSVTLQVQAVEPGKYIRKTDPAYAQRWEDRAMRDDGTNGDVRAGDGVWTAVLPAEHQSNRRLVRYRIRAAAAGGAVVQMPYADDPVPNFAYYVWAGPSAWTGARHKKAAPVTFSGDFLRTLPTFTLIADGEDVARSQWDGGYNHRRMPGTMVYNGRVFDHMEFKNRGSASTYVTGKNKWGFHFADGHELPMRDPWGRPYPATWNSFAMNACASPWVQINRGMTGLDEAVSFRCYQLAGVPASDTHPIHFRVVASAEEQGKSQYEGDLWGLYLIVEDVDGGFLDNHDWGDGLIASHEKGLKRVPAGMENPDAVWGKFREGPRGGNAEKWWRENMDVQSYFSFHAVNRLVGNVDLRPGANHHFYQHPERGWMPVPWDLDMQFIPRSHQPGYIDQIRCLDVPALALEYRNRAREILDLLASDPSPSGGQIGQVVAEYARKIEPNGPLAPDRSWANLDAILWDQHPRSGTRGSYFQKETSQEMFGGSFTRTLATADFAGFCRYVVEYATDSRLKKDYKPNDGNPQGYGWGYLQHEAKDDQIPERPVIRYTGPEGFPRGNLTFAVSPFADPQGSQTFGAVQWRLAAVGPAKEGPWHYEIEPLWVAPESPAQVPEVHAPSILCRPGVTYRVRARYKDNTGRWSHWSAPVEWTAR